MGRTASEFVHALCRRHADWADDRTLGGATPLGWRPLVRSLFEGMSVAMADAPGARVAVARLEAAGDRLSVEIRNDAGRPTPTWVLRAIERMVDEAERTSSEVCPFCGRDFGPGAAVDGRVVRHVGSRPTCRPSPPMRRLLEAGGDL
jgi:hypothetical protein